MLKQFVAFARVSSLEQKREGFSLEDQECRLADFAARLNGEVIQLFKVAETASKRELRRTFRDMLAYARRHARRLSGVLFAKVDRATRNISDWVELERLEKECGVPVLIPDQPLGDTPTGRFQRRMSVNIAAYQVEQQAVDIRAGHRRRVESGLPVSSAAFGYVNVRINGRGVVRVHPNNAATVRLIFELYAYHGHTLDSLVEELARRGIIYTDRTPRFTRSTLNRMLNNRHYLGEVLYQGVWYPGSFEPLIDHATFRAVQDRLRGKVYRAHQMSFAGSLIKCGHCGHVVTGEKKVKQSPTRGTQTYVYYRCSKYSKIDHPRHRVTESELDDQLTETFQQLRLRDDDLRQWVTDVIRARAGAASQENEEHRREVERQLCDVELRLTRLMNMRMEEEISAQEYAEQRRALQERRSGIQLQIETLNRDVREVTDLAIRAFELSQQLREKWLAADYDAKRTILTILASELRLNSKKLQISLRKPFDVLAAGVENESNGAMGI